ncbi:type I-B CRISPR-associated protein Cas8b1/Cst1 [hot springs metagenome]|uniref:Type I-B CRISPR-associated protein Cas8b1/Cst1 n=1 Tax=hot springs metagenome TaxID=433727 RepID=A0A5J4L1I3_9ZZZZ
MEPIILYPSNWLYNASVIGFLKSISDIEQQDVEKWFEDNIVSLPRDIFKELKINERYFNDSKNDKISSIIGKSSLYRNYINSSRKQDKLGFVEFVKELSQVVEHGQEFCGICSRNFALLPENIKILNEKWAKHSQSMVKQTKKTKGKGSKPKENDFEIFLSKLQKYNVAHNNLIAPSTGGFPNAFWNLNDSISICPLCAYLVIHHHIPFKNAETHNGQIFINAPSFKVMWYLNKFAEQMLSKNKNYQVREILGISFMELAQKVAVTLGAWSIMNIEMIIKKREEIEYYSLPLEISRVLLHKEIASLVSATKEPLIFEIVLNGSFDYLLTLSHKVLRYSVTGSNAFNDKYLSKLRNRDAYSLKNLSKILPELYVKITSTINKEVMK